MQIRHTLTAVLLTFGLAHNALADEIHAAVAANFTSPFKELAAKFEQASGHTVIPSFGSTGKLYAQITQDAPFDVFYAADRERPEQLVKEGKAVADSLYTFAFGKLALWSSDPKRVDAAGKVLEQDDFNHLAIVNPKTAPYGVVAENILKKIGHYEALKDKIVYGETLTQCYQFVVTGNAELAFIAVSQLKEKGAEQGSSWLVPLDLYDPIPQGAVILQKAADKPAVKAFMEFMRSPAAIEVIKEYGYLVE